MLVQSSSHAALDSYPTSDLQSTASLHSLLQSHVVAVFGSFASAVVALAGGGDDAGVDGGDAFLLQLTSKAKAKIDDLSACDMPALYSDFC